MQFNDFQALSFDCYGTLIDWETGIRAYLTRLRTFAANAPETDELLETYGEMEAEAEHEHPALLYREILAIAFRNTAAMHAIEVSESLVEAFAHSVPEWPAFPDSSEALHRLHRHFKLIILSNIDRASFAASNSRLNVVFDAVLTAEDIGSYKPDPRNFEALLAHTRSAGIASGELLHVAQSLFHDHAPAKAMGLPTVWINRRHDQSGVGATPDVGDGVQPDWTFSSMADFADAVLAASDGLAL